MLILAVTVPWWGTGVFTLVGGVVGAFVAGLVGLVRDRHADRVKDLSEHREIVRTATASFASEFHAMVSAAMEARATHKPISRPSQLLIKYSLLSITAEADIVVKADAAREAYHKFRDLVTTQDRAKWSLAGKECQRAIEELTNAARRISGLPALPATPTLLGKAPVSEPAEDTAIAPTENR
jgi:hypothetical protein